MNGCNPGWYRKCQDWSRTEILANAYAQKLLQSQTQCIQTPICSIGNAAHDCNAYAKIRSQATPTTLSKPAASRLSRGWLFPLENHHPHNTNHNTCSLTNIHCAHKLLITPPTTNYSCVHIFICLRGGCDPCSSTRVRSAERILPVLFQAQHGQMNPRLSLRPDQ